MEEQITQREKKSSDFLREELFFFKSVIIKGVDFGEREKKKKIF